MPRRRRHRWFKVVGADGLTMRICGDPGMPRETMEALLALGRAMETMGAQMTEEPLSTDPITADLTVTFPNEAALIRATFAAGAVASSATLYRSTAAPWQLKATQGVMDDAEWRSRLVSLVEVLLPGRDANG
jgi:hypothetical protein